MIAFMDSTAPAAVVSVSPLVNNLVSSARTAKELTKQSTDSELKEQISDLFADEENRSLRAKLAQKASVTRNPEFGYYFANGDPDPHCPKCYEGAEKMIHLPKAEPWSGGVRRDCVECQQTFWEKPMVPSYSFAVPATRRIRWE